MKKKFALGILAGLFVAALICQSSVAFAYTLEDLIGLSEQIQNHKAGILFELRADKSSYQVGEPVVFNFKADKDCYLVLLDIGTSGRTIILFPNRWHPDNKIEKDKLYRIPPVGSEFGYKVEGPAGTERVKAIASVDPALSKIESLQNELRMPAQAPPAAPANAQAVAVAQVFVTIRDPGAVLKDIGVAFANIDPSKWATATLKFNVTGSGSSSAAPQGATAAAAASVVVGGPAPSQR